jgi:rRNA-processing protein FCF1
MAKRLEYAQCAHVHDPVSAEECIHSVLEASPKTYIVASQAFNLQKTVGRMPGVPLIYFYNSIMTLGEPSGFDKNFMDRVRLRQMN